MIPTSGHELKEEWNQHNACRQFTLQDNRSFHPQSKISDDIFDCG
ncbi:MAG: hypothetical protein GXP08_11435 [Gammaproteobacteria bacterium]|nr:hypothetical protein [Gammaproteobacteria bacterium]